MESSEAVFPKSMSTNPATTVNGKTMFSKPNQPTKKALISANIRSIRPCSCCQIRNVLKNRKLSVTLKELQGEIREADSFCNCH
ncbi:unnamed protein product [Macrosiphum euphorbiae]|uniref:Uncharacterized protein n=1 Tax=Macrosiphum euphorbiae TaxID=13131 RepID=A0AAV0WI34_9HEMI|nr:unnamed protein product [Macrosiphum euphorbiae]